MTIDLNRESLIKDLEDLGSENVSFFGGKFTGGVRLQQWIPEYVDLLLYLIKEFPCDNAINFLEVGAASGGNTFVLNRFLNIGKTVIVDDNSLPQSKLRNGILVDIRPTEIIGDSQSEKIFEEVKSLGLEYDLIFIDADHSYKGVKRDFELYSTLRSNRSRIVFHDISPTIRTSKGANCFVDLLWTELKEKFPNNTEFYYPPEGFGLGVLEFND